MVHFSYKSASLFILGLACLPRQVLAQSCSTLSNSLPQPSVASDYNVQLVLQDLKSPRTLLFDTEGYLLILEQGVGVVRYAFDSDCEVPISDSRQVVVDDEDLNHGLALSADGNTLYASTIEFVYQYSYTSSSGTTGDRKTLINGMRHAGHSTRTLLLSQSVPDLLIVSRGSGPNLDELAEDISTGRSQIRGFNISTLQTSDDSEGVDYSSNGILFGWGLRNSVGLAEDATGQLWSVENSADNLERETVDVHQNNPGEEMNYHGYLNDTTARGNYGYPLCFAVWASRDFDFLYEGAADNVDRLETGEQFALNVNDSFTDQTCREGYVAPRVTFQAHMAPLDVLFDKNGDAWVAFHGSWNRDDPAGYKVSLIRFNNSQPSTPPESTTAVIDILSNGDSLRPAGLVLSPRGDLYVSSDATGEVYVIRRNDGVSIGPVIDATNSTGTTDTSGNGQSGTATATSDGEAAVENTSAAGPGSTTTAGSGSNIVKLNGGLVGMMVLLVVSLM